MTNETLIGLIVSFALVVVGVVFNTSIKQIIKQYYSKLTKKQIVVLLLGVLGLVLVFSDFLTPLFSEENENGKIQFIKENYEAQKSDTEVIVNAADTGFQLAGELINQQKKKDSIIRANKEAYWVYQIGVPKRSKNELWETYKLLQHIPNVKVFKESRKSFYIIKDDGIEKDSLVKGEIAFKASINKIENRINIIDLATFCKVRKQIAEGDRLKIRKPKVKLPCLICD